jgi:isoleucyl-tRNA synthetase
MKTYKQVSKIPDFPVMERELLRFWEENRIFQRLREQNSNGPKWSFLDGPITANNPMGVHHAWGRSLKDMYLRYHAMNGKRLRYQNGFDCQGLWVEVEVEKSLGLQTKREILNYGIERFVRECKERVLTFAARQTEQSIRLGYWCDWDDPQALLVLRDALVRDARGEEMHKSKGNSIAFDEAAEVFGAEVMRYIYAEQKTGQNLNFPDLHPSANTGQTLDAEARRKLLTFWNCYSFFVMYATADGWQPDGQKAPLSNELDRWILSRLQRLIEGANNAFQNFEHFRLIEAFQVFDEELSNWYLRRSRRRFWNGEKEAYQTLYDVLTTVTRAMAPALPFLTEEIYQNLVRSTDPAAPESVHLTRYPQPDNALIDETLEKNIETVIRLKNHALSLRTQSKTKIRQPLGVVYVRPIDAADRRIIENTQYAGQILEETNLKTIELIEDEKTIVRMRLKLNMPKVGPRAGKHLGALAKALEQADPESILKGENNTFNVDGQEFVLAPDEIILSYEGPANLKCSLENGTFMALNTILTPELLQEGIARDFNRLLQDQRKALNLDVSDRVAITYCASQRIADAIRANESFLCNELLAKRLDLSASLPDGLKLKLGGEEIFVTIARIAN